MFLFLPLSIATLGGLPKMDIGSGSGFFSLTRQLGGSIGIALITTMVDKFQIVHRARLVYHVTEFDPAYAERLSAAKSYFSSFTGDPVLAQNQALAQIDRAINGQAALLSYVDVFHIVGLVFLLALPLVFLLSRGNSGQGQTAPLPAE